MRSINRKSCGLHINEDSVSVSILNVQVTNIHSEWDTVFFYDISSHQNTTIQTGVIMTAESTQTFMNTGLPLFSDLPYKVADLSAPTVEFGRKEIELAEHEMQV